MIDIEQFAGHTPGPLTVDNTKKHAIYVRDAKGETVLHAYRHAFSSDDKTAEEAIECVNFFRSSDESIADYKKRVGEARAANLQQIADFRLYASAPDLLAEVVRLREALREIRDQNTIEMALDPQWAARVARHALGGPHV